MTQKQFIEEVAKYVQKYAPQYGIKVVSSIVAQAILESASGTSELAVNAHNYFGLKYRVNRCPSACGIYYKNGSEQNSDGTYTISAMRWMKFSNMELGIKGYFEFINVYNYANLKGVTDPKTYLENIKKDGYATSINYVSNLLAVISKYNLTQYDTLNDAKDDNIENDNKEGNNMKKPVISLSAGHGLYTAGKRCMKAIDPNETREWYLNDRIIDKVEAKLKAYNCTVVRVNDTNGTTDTALATRAKTSDNANADVYLSMHHNAGLSGRSGGGTVVLYYSSNADRPKQAQKLYNAIVAQTGLIGNRSSEVVKQNVYECRVPKAPAFLVENGFMDSWTDVPIILSEDHAEKTAVGVVNFLVDLLSLTKNGTVVTTTTTTAKPSTPSNTTTYTVVKGDTLSKIGSKTGVAWKTIADLNGIKFPYVVRVGQVLKLANTSTSTSTVTTTTASSASNKYVYNGVDYSLVFDPTYYASKYSDLKKAFGNNSTALFNHFKIYGMKEGRQGSANFNVIAYKNRYTDLQKAFGNNLPDYYKHYCQFGAKEERSAL